MGWFYKLRPYSYGFFPKSYLTNSFKDFFFKMYVYVCVPMWAYFYVGGSKMVSDLLKLELKAVVSHDVLGTKSRSSTRAVSTANHQAIFSSLPHQLSFVGPSLDKFSLYSPGRLPPCCYSQTSGVGHVLSVICFLTFCFYLTLSLT